MKEYHKINSVYKRDEKGNFIIGEWSEPEFEYLKDNPWLWTEKIDGTNIRVMFVNEDITETTFGGKTDNAQIPAKLVSHLQYTFTNDLLESVFGRTEGVCLYGEGYGAGIQKGGGNYSLDQRFILFDVKIGNWWLKRADIEDIADKLNIPVVPVMGEFRTLTQMVAMVKTGAETMVPSSTINMTAKMEGWVGTPLVPLFNRKGERIITKLKYKDFR